MFQCCGHSATGTHAIARMMVNLKNGGDYQKHPGLCDEHILQLSKALSEDTFDQLSDLMDEYCNVVLARSHREDLIDVIFGSVVVQEKHGNESYSDFGSDSSENEDCDSFEVDPQFGGRVSDWMSHLDEESTEESVECDDEFEIASDDDGDESEVVSTRDDDNEFEEFTVESETEDSSDDEFCSVDSEETEDPVEKVCTIMQFGYVFFSISVF